MLKDALSRMADVFSASALVQGKDYQQLGYVINIRLSDGLLKARVKGRSGRIYNVHINLKIWPREPARCSCEINKNCKHAAASFFALQAAGHIDIPPSSKSPNEQSFDAWLDSLSYRQALREPVDSVTTLVYLIEFHHAPYEDRALIRLATAKRLKRGGLSKKVRLNVLPENRKRFSVEDEEVIGELFQKNTTGRWFDYLTLRNSDLLQKIIKSERAYLYADDRIRLRLEQEIKVDLLWQTDKEGRQWPVLHQEGLQLKTILLDQAWYFNVTHYSLGLMALPCQLQQLKQIQASAPVVQENSEAVSYKVALIDAALPLPKLYRPATLRTKPKAIARFSALALSTQEIEHTMLFMVEIAFDYQGSVFTSSDTQQTVFFTVDDVIIYTARNHEFENEKLNEIGQLLHLRGASIQEKILTENELNNQLVLSRVHTQKDIQSLQNNTIALLKNKDWQIEYLHTAYDEILEEDNVEWYSEIEEKGQDFFAYRLGILVEGKPVNIVPLVVQLISQFNEKNLSSLDENKTIILPLSQGKALRIQWQRIKPFIEFLLQYGRNAINEEQQLTLSRYQLLLMQESEQALAATTLRWRGAEQIRTQLQALKDISLLKNVAIPKGLRAELRDYQYQGLNWLQFLRAQGFGGVLADDMGLGKTVQTLAHMQLEKELGHLTRASLIVAPTSLVVNWFEEAKRFTPELKVLIFHGSSRHQDEFDDYDLVISTYGLIQRDKTRFINYSFYYLILDEAQFIKNARAKTSQIIQQLHAKHRLCLSGTPLENHLGELWSLFHFLMPGLLGDAKEFQRFFKMPIEKYSDTDRRILLAGRVRPFMLRRNKNQVASELPDKTEMVRMVELNGSQRDLYETIRLSMEKKVREAIARQGLGKSQIVLLDALLKLRQVCCDPRLVSLPAATLAHGNSVKLDALLDLLDNLVEEGRCVLIFSQFTSMLALIEEQLNARHYPYLKLTGQTKNRQHVVNQFQSGDFPIFLISLKAGGTGLNLTRADTVIHYDPWWNPAAEDQATDRSHRIGQENPVFVYKLITKGTVEEAILAMQEKKRSLFEGILSDNAAALTKLTDADLELFFVPLGG